MPASERLRRPASDPPRTCARWSSAQTALRAVGSLNTCPSAATWFWLESDPERTAAAVRRRGDADRRPRPSGGGGARRKEPPGRYLLPGGDLSTRNARCFRLLRGRDRHRFAEHLDCSRQARAEIETRACQQRLRVPVVEPSAQRGLSSGANGRLCRDEIGRRGRPPSACPGCRHRDVRRKTVQPHRPWSEQRLSGSFGRNPAPGCGSGA